MPRVIAIAGAIMLYSLATRTLLDISVLHDRNPLFVTLSDGSVRNAYTVRFLNKRNDLRVFELSVSTALPTPMMHSRRRRRRRTAAAVDRGRARPDARGARARHRAGRREARQSRLR